ncbi:helix-turn-helix domain-containing protein [Oceanisphaera litoralis]|uniref:helix-turn-helix domain-containing protein n=1 Tax=Oceanisphaera litoralis TaxID=225144 RepID=UPI00195A8607|nr:XRE family transcriptional regulator [Oceanisphaera litoralis]
MQEPNKYLAIRLRTLRKERGWSLDRCASETGVSKAMLGQIERGESSPTIATLWKIAGGFHTSLSDFLEPTPEPHPGPLYRQADRLRRQPAGDGILVAPLFPFEGRFGFEMLELTLLPGYERRSEPHEPGVIEHVIVQRGEMELLLEGRWQPLAPGAAVRFHADRPHSYRNPGDTPAVFYNLIHYPKP